MSPKLKKINQVLFALLVVILYFGYEIYFVPATAPETKPEVQGVSTVAPVQESTSNQFFESYFTVPENKFIGNTQDSIEYQLIDKINSADVSLYGAFFEFDLDSVADAFIAAHQRGVEVIIIYDNEHTQDDPQIKRITDSGIVTIADNRSAFMHNKFLVVDSECVWTGSFNLTENAAYKNNENAVYICDNLLAENYEAEFSEMFNSQFGARSPANTPNPQFEINEVMVENYFAPEDDVMDKVIATVETAEVSINFLVFSFTDDELAKTMLFRQTDNVSVKGIFETRGASTESSQCSRLVKNGADIKLDGNSYTMHHKVIIIDSKIVLFGSFNFSENANKNNDENLLIVHSPSLASQYEQEFQKLFADGITPKSNCKTE